MCNKFWYSVFGKGTQPFDFIKRKEIRKLADEVKYILVKERQCSGGPFELSLTIQK